LSPTILEKIDKWRKGQNAEFLERYEAL
jgi:hypothetical protein